MSGLLSAGLAGMIAGTVVTLAVELIRDRLAERRLRAAEAYVAAAKKRDAMRRALRALEAEDGDHRAALFALQAGEDHEAAGIIWVLHVAELELREAA